MSCARCRSISWSIPDHLSTVLDLVMNQLCQGKAIEHHENRFLRPDGSACWLRWTAQPSKELKVAYCVGQDVTGQKAAEQQKRDHENLLTDLIEVSSAPMMIHDHESRILALNSAFTDLLGYTVEDLPDLEAWERHAYPDPQYRSENEAHPRGDVFPFQAGRAAPGFFTGTEDCVPGRFRTGPGRRAEAFRVDT